MLSNAILSCIHACIHSLCLVLSVWIYYLCCVVFARLALPSLDTVLQIKLLEHQKKSIISENNHIPQRVRDSSNGTTHGTWLRLNFVPGPVTLLSLLTSRISRVLYMSRVEHSAKHEKYWNQWSWLVCCIARTTIDRRTYVLRETCIDRNIT